MRPTTSFEVETRLRCNAKAAGQMRAAGHMRPITSFEVETQLRCNAKLGGQMRVAGHMRPACGKSAPNDKKMTRGIFVMILNFLETC